MRNKLLLPGVLFILAVLGCSGLTGTTWETVSEGGITVQMPGKPTKQPQTMDTAAGKITVTMMVLDKGAEAYMMAYNDLPAAIASRVTDPQPMLSSGRDGALRNINGKLISERPVNLGSYQGREIIGEGNTQGKDVVLTARVYWASPRLVQVMYMREKSKSESADAKKFLDSLQIQ